MSLFKNIESLPQTYTTSLWQSQNKTPTFNSLLLFTIPFSNYLTQNYLKKLISITYWKENLMLDVNLQ